MAYDLTPYLAKPFEMTAGKWTITSPVPSVKVGKLLTGFQALQAEQARRAEAGEPPLVDEAIDGMPNDLEGLARLVLSDAEYDRLVDEDCPVQYIMNAATAALIYWANGGNEAAVAAYNEALQDATSGASRPKAQTRKPSKNGRPTA